MALLIMIFISTVVDSHALKLKLRTRFQIHKPVLEFAGKKDKNRKNSPSSKIIFSSGMKKKNFLWKNIFSNS